MGNAAFSDLMTDLLLGDNLGSDTVVLTLPGVTPATVTTAHVQRMRTNEEGQDRNRGSVAASELTVRVLVSALPGTLAAASASDWTRGEVAIDGTDYGIDEVLLRHGLLRLTLGGELLAERTRANLRR